MSDIKSFNYFKVNFLTFICDNGILCYIFDFILYYGDFYYYFLID